MPTNALHSLTKNGGGSFKLRNRISSSKDHTHQILLTRSNSTHQPNSPSTPSPTASLASPPLSPSSTLQREQPLFPTNGSATPIGGGSLRRSSRAGSLTSIPESMQLQEALQEAADQLSSKKSDYPIYGSTMMMSKKMSSSSLSLFSEGARALVTVLESGEEVFGLFLSFSRNRKDKLNLRSMFGAN